MGRSVSTVRTEKRVVKNYKQYTMHTNIKAHKEEGSVSAFAAHVRKVVQEIPRGSTLSYSAVAALAGNPRAARAVARIMAANFDPGIPCHRVIRADGSVGGYNRGGATAKQKILNEERSHHS